MVIISALAKYGILVLNMLLGIVINMMVSYFRKINCVSKCSLHEMLVRESHGGGMMGHFGVKKTLEILQEYFYRPSVIP